MVPAVRHQVVIDHLRADHSTANSKAPLTDAQKEAIRAVVAQPPKETSLFDQIKAKIEKAGDNDVLDVAADLIGEVADEAQRAELAALYNARKESLSQ